MNFAPNANNNSSAGQPGSASMLYGKRELLKWKKYKIKEVQFGPIYRVCPGVTVRQNNRGTWMIYLERNNQRKNISVGNSKGDLDKAIKMAEGIDEKFQEMDRGIIPDESPAVKTSFKGYSKAWLENNAGRWSGGVESNQGNFETDPSAEKHAECQ